MATKKKEEPPKGAFMVRDTGGKVEKFSNEHFLKTAEGLAKAVAPKKPKK